MQGCRGQILHLSKRIGKAKSDLPFGNYYLKEISTDQHYILSDEKFSVSFEYAGQTVDVVDIKANDGKSIYGDDDFKDYEFISDEGTFECEYVGRWMNKDENLVCCFDFDDGRKVRSMAWQNNGYYKLEQIPLGSRLRLEFKMSNTGKNYLRKVVIL